MEIVNYGNPILKTPTHQVTEFNEELLKYAKDYILAK